MHSTRRIGGVFTFLFLLSITRGEELSNSNSAASILAASVGSNSTQTNPENMTEAIVPFNPDFGSSSSKNLSLESSTNNSVQAPKKLGTSSTLSPLTELSSSKSLTPSIKDSVSENSANNSLVESQSPLNQSAKSALEVPLLPSTLTPSNQSGSSEYSKRNSSKKTTLSEPKVIALSTSKTPLALPTNDTTPPANGHSGCYAHFETKDGCAYRTSNNNCKSKKTSIAIEQFGLDEMKANPGGSNVTGRFAQGAIIPTRAKRSRRALPPPGTPAVASTTPNLSSLPPTSPLTPNTSVTDMASSSAPFPSVLSPTSPSSPSGVSGSQGICGAYNPEVDEGVCLWDGTDITGNDPSKSGWINGALPTNCNKTVVVKRGNSTGTFKVINGCNFSTLDPAVGCQQIYLTVSAFKKLNPTATELADGKFKDSLEWDFLAESQPN